MHNELTAELGKATTGLANAMMLFDTGQFANKPTHGWSAAQTAEHVLKSIAGIPALFGGGHRNAGRDPFQQLTTIRAIFLDFESKMESPQAILPSQHPPSKEELLLEIARSFELIQRKAGEVDLTQLFTDFPFPGMGELTGYEWIYFVTAHTQRHTVQVSKIYKSLSQQDISVSTTN